MNQDLLEQKIHEWEPEGAEVVRTIDSYDNEVERIVKFEGWYYLYRYFLLHGNEARVHVSVDLNRVSPDHIIQELGERL